MLQTYPYRILSVRVTYLLDIFCISVYSFGTRSCNLLSVFQHYVTELRSGEKNIGRDICRDSKDTRLTGTERNYLHTIW